MTEGSEDEDEDEEEAAAEELRRERHDEVVTLHHLNMINNFQLVSFSRNRWWLWITSD